MGYVASLFFPFWCFDAKGGEVALVDHGNLQGLGHKHMLLPFLESLCPYLHFIRACGTICFCWFICVEQFALSQV